jgi:large subunit ribosomal protein L4
MEVSVMNMSGKQVKKIDLPADIFEVEVNTGLMHQAFVRQMANARQGTHKTKTRGEVRMTKAKAYRQKGTGRARHGAKSAPIFVGGGIAHGPRPHKYTKSMPKKMRRQAIRCALSALARDEQLVFVDEFKLDAPKTKDVQTALDALAAGQTALVLLADVNENVQSGINNIPDEMYLRASYLNIRDLLKFDKVIVPMDALEVIRGIWGREG